MVYLILVNTVFVSKLYETFKKHPNKSIKLIIGNTLFFPLLILIACIITTIGTQTTTDPVYSSLYAWIGHSVTNFSQAMLCLLDNWNSIRSKYNHESENLKSSNLKSNNSALQTKEVSVSHG